MRSTVTILGVALLFPLLMPFAIVIAERGREWGCVR